MSNNSYVRVPPDGSGKKIFSKQHNIEGEPVQVQSVHLSSNDNIENILKIDQDGAIYTRYTEGSPILAPYGDMKVIDEHIVGVYEHTNDAYDDLFYILEENGGTSEYQNEFASVLMSVTSDVNSKVKRITNRYHYSQIGTTLLIVMTISLGDSGIEGNIRSWGYANDDYGLLFQLNGTTLNLLLRGSPQGDHGDEIRIPQSEWNIDKLDGSGPSGIVLDLTKAYQYYININWPFGKVEFGIYSSSHGRVKCHQDINDGIFTFPYVKSSSLPIYFENVNETATGSPSEMRVISAVVKTEGNTDYTFWRFGDLGCTNKPVNGETPILSIKPKMLLDSGVKNTINSYPETISIFSTNSPVRIRMVWCNDDIFTNDTWLLDSIDGPLIGDNDATLIDSNADSYWNTETFYVNAGEAKDINLDRFFELNDEGILLGGDGVTQGVLSFTAESLNGIGTTVSCDFSYKALY